MKRSFPVIDADGHGVENVQELRAFLPSAFQKEDGKREYALFLRDGWMRGGNLYYSCAVGESTLASVAALMGGTQLIWPSDFPHEKPWDELSSDLDKFIGRDDLLESTTRQILCDNPSGCMD